MRDEDRPERSRDVVDHDHETGLSIGEWRVELAGLSRTMRTPHPPNERGLRFAKLITDARKAAGLTQEQLCATRIISRTTLVRWEMGRAERPDPDQVRDLCQALGIEPIEAAVALGYLTREEARGEVKLEPMISEVIALLDDPDLPDDDRERWIDYLRYLAARHRAQREMDES